MTIDHHHAWEADGALYHYACKAPHESTWYWLGRVIPPGPCPEGCPEVSP